MKNLVEDGLAGFVDKKLNGEYDVRITRDDAGTKMLALEKEVPMKFWNNDIRFGDDDTKVYVIYVYVYEDDERLFSQTFIPTDAQIRLENESMVMDKGSFVWDRFRVKKSDYTVERFLEEEVIPYLENRF